MAVGVWVKRLAVIVPTAVFVVAAGLYLLASWVPGSYRPARLTEPERRLVASDEFVPHILAFGNRAQENQPYTWSIEQRQLNEYLASVDEIADYLSPGPGRTGRAYEVLEEAHLAEPAAALDDGVLRLMVRETRYNKILSVGISFVLDQQGLLRVRLRRLRIGCLRVPESWFQDQLEQFRRRMLREMPQPEAPIGPAAQGRGFVGVSCDDLGELLAILVRATDRHPLRPILTWPIGDKTVRVERIVIDDGRLTLHLVPHPG